MPSYTFATGVPNIVPAVYATSDTGETTDLNTTDTATASSGVLTLTLDVGDYYAKWSWQGDTHTTDGEVANPAGVQSLGEVSGGSSLVAVDRSVGFNGGFGGDTFTPVTTDTGNGFFPVPFDEAYTLADSTPVTVDTDNAYMTWDADAPETFTVKQAGWYDIERGLQFSAPLTDPVGLHLETGSGQNYQPIPAGYDRGGVSGPRWLDADTPVTLQIDTRQLSVGVEVAYAWLIIRPLTALA